MKFFKTIFIISFFIFPIYSVENYFDNGDGTIKDNYTGLTWQKCGVGQNYLDCTGTANQYSWSDAINQCESLNLAGKVDWRLPNINELISIIKEGSFNPAINSSYFPNTIADNGHFYWSSTNQVRYSDHAWYVSYFDGRVHSREKTYNAYYVRCVRGP